MSETATIRVRRVVETNRESGSEQRLVRGFVLALRVVWFAVAGFCIFVTGWGIGVAIIAAWQRWLEVVVWIVIAKLTLWLLKMLINSFVRFLKAWSGDGKAPNNDSTTAG